MSDPLVDPPAESKDDEPLDVDAIIAFQRFLDRVEEELAATDMEPIEADLVRMLYGAGFHADARKRASDGVVLPDYPCCYRCLCGRHDECEGGDCECQG